MTDIQLLLFDLDDTLWHTPPVIARAEAGLLAWLAAHAPRLQDAAAVLQAEKQRLIAAEPQLAARVSSLRRRSLLAALLRAGYPQAEAARLAEQAFQHFYALRQQVEPFADVAITLQRLAGDYQLGILSNGNADIGCTALARWFSFALNAEQLGIAKPDPRTFGAALLAAGVQPHAAVHIGDHPLDDIAGARGAGLRCIWMNPQGKAWQGGDPADASIRRIAELPDTLRRLRRHH